MRMETPHNFLVEIIFVSIIYGGGKQNLKSEQTGVPYRNTPFSLTP